MVLRLHQTGGAVSEEVIICGDKKCGYVCQRIPGHSDGLHATWTDGSMMATWVDEKIGVHVQRLSPAARAFIAEVQGAE